MCSKGCCKVGQYIYGKDSKFFEYDSDSDNNNIDGNEISHYEAFDALYDVGNPLYNLPAYCVEIGHIECLKTISKEEQFMYHADLAMIAVEQDNLECLKYIIEEMGDVKLNLNDQDVGPNCKDYVNDILLKLNGQTYIDKNIFK